MPRVPDAEENSAPFAHQKNSQRKNKMSLDVYLTKAMPTTVFESNITHNLGVMADSAGVYEELWRPSEIGIDKAGLLIDPLDRALKLLESDPKRFEKFDTNNGWGTYDSLVSFIREYLKACKENPDASVSVSR